MTRHEVIKYTLNDFGYREFMERYRYYPPSGILFKYPPTAPRSENNQPETL